MRKINEDATPSEKARKATLGIIARLGACAYLAYIIVKMGKLTSAGESGMSPTLSIVIIVVLGLGALFLIALTLKDFAMGIKNQDYSMQKYAAEDLRAKGLKYNKHGELVPLDDNSDELEELERERRKNAAGDGDIVDEDDVVEDDDEYYYEEIDEEEEEE